MRKELSAFFALLLLCHLAQHRVEARVAPAIFRVGILIPESGRSEAQLLRGLGDELRDRGYQEGKNLLSKFATPRETEARWNRRRPTS